MGGGYRNMKWRWSEGIDYYCVIAAVIDDGGVSSRRETTSRKGGKECVLVDVAPNCTVFQAYDRISPLKTQRNTYYHSSKHLPVYIVVIPPTTV